MKIFIGGDISPTEASEPFMASGDIRAAFGDVCDLVKGADLFVVNLECALTEKNTPIRKCGPNLKARPACAAALKALGVTDAGLSNNHVYDFGSGGFHDTLAALDEAGIRYTGVGRNEQDARKPHYMQARGKTVALVCVCEHEYSYALPDREGCWGFDPFETMEDVAIAKAHSDYVIVLYHGGKEQSRYPSPRLRRACQAMVRAGADLVLCQHSHCIGVPESYRGGYIVYGQGNFNFVTHRDHPHWLNGLLLELDLDEAMKPAFTFHPLRVNEHGVQLCQGEEKQRLLDEFYARTAVLQDDAAWMKEWNDFCLSVQPGYRRAIAVAFQDDAETPQQVFPHYLDCEAHTDVWRQLYPTWNGDNTIETGK
ncbi:MAG: CapA family protein [Clostridia bacterium]|nr:CapA family protein [Clostridia bacterium]